MLSKIVAGNILFFFIIIIFAEKKRLGISYEPFVRQKIPIKCLALFSKKKKKKERDPCATIHLPE